MKGSHKLSRADAKEIRRLWWEEELSYKQIAKQFKVHPQSILLVVQGKSYPDASYSPPSLEERRRRMKRGGKSLRQFTDKAIFSIFRLWLSGEYTVDEIANLHDAPKGRVENVLYGQSYRDVAKRAKEKLGIGRVCRGGTIRPVSDGEMYTILKLYYSSDQLTVPQIAKLVDRPESTVDNILYGYSHPDTVRQIKAEIWETRS